MGVTKTGLRLTPCERIELMESRLARDVSLELLLVGEGSGL